MAVNACGNVDMDLQDLAWEEPAEVMDDLDGLTITTNPPIGPVLEDHQNRSRVPAFIELRKCHRTWPRFAELDRLRTEAICDGLLDNEPMPDRDAA